MDTYRSTYEEAVDELGSLLNEQSRLETRIEEIRVRCMRLRKIIDSLGVLLGESKDIGLTDAIREILEVLSFMSLTATDIRDQLHEREFPLDGYKQPVSVIHTTLKRLRDQGEIKSEVKDGKTCYIWIED